MKTQTGFTLIEVLIAMLLLAAGLLGLAALQTTTLRSNVAAYNHGQAIQLLYDMSDRMRANSKTVASNYKTPNSNTYAQSNKPVVACNTVSTDSTACKPEDLANNDLIEWNTAITTTLSKGSGSITSTDNTVFTLSITWDDNRDDKIDGDDPSFIMGLQL